MYEEVIIVCEGRCNPGINDYDQAASRRPPGPIHGQSVVAIWGRSLRHTTHIAKTNEKFNDDNGCWDKVWVCAVCGHHRRY